MLEFVSNKQMKKLRIMRVVTRVKSKGGHAQLLCVTTFSKEQCLSLFADEVILETDSTLVVYFLALVVYES